MQIPRITKIPTLTEAFPQLVQDQIMKQQTSLLTAILELHKTIQNFEAQPRTASANQDKLQLRVVELSEELADAKLEINELSTEVYELQLELDACETQIARYEQIEQEAHRIEKNFQENRFQTLQGYYKNATERAKQLQDELKITKDELAKISQKPAPTGYKSWEDAAVTERLQHNETKLELVTLKAKLEKFENLFEQVFNVFNS